MTGIIGIIKKYEHFHYLNRFRFRVRFQSVWTNTHKLQTHCYYYSMV